MDADLQDPPEVVLEMVAKWREGYDVVYGQRRSRAGETASSSLTAKIFYRLFAAMIPIEVPARHRRLPPHEPPRGRGAARACARRTASSAAWSPGSASSRPPCVYDRPARFAGETKYPLRKMLRFAIDGITSFSILPLRFAHLPRACSSSVLSVGGRDLGRSSRTSSSTPPCPGWTTMIVLVSFLSACSCS